MSSFPSTTNPALPLRLERNGSKALPPSSAPLDATTLHCERPKHASSMGMAFTQLSLASFRPSSQGIHLTANCLRTSSTTASFPSNEQYPQHPLPPVPAPHALTHTHNVRSRRPRRLFPGLLWARSPRKWLQRRTGRWSGRCRRARWWWPWGRTGRRRPQLERRGTGCSGCGGSGRAAGEEEGGDS